MALAGTGDKPGEPRVGWWILERCPGPERFPYRLTIARRVPSVESLVLRVADLWPTGTQHVFCLREESPPPEGAPREELERVPLLAVEKMGAKLTVILDRPRLRRCDFVFTRRAYKNPTPGRESYEQIFWRTQRGAQTHRTPARLALTSAVSPMHVRIASEERYPWTFPGATVARGRLPCGDYALMDGETVRAIIERKTFDNMLSDLANPPVLHQRLLDLALHEHHALVLEAPYTDFLNPKKVHHLNATFCARILAELSAVHPRLHIIFMSNRKMANLWARQYFDAVRRVARGGSHQMSLDIAASEVLPPQQKRPRRPSADGSQKPLP